MLCHKKGRSVDLRIRSKKKNLRPSLQADNFHHFLTIPSPHCLTVIRVCILICGQKKELVCTPLFNKRIEMMTINLIDMLLYPPIFTTIKRIDMLLYPLISNEFLAPNTGVCAIVIAVAKTYDDKDLSEACSGQSVFQQQHKTTNEIYDCFGEEIFMPLLHDF